MKFISEINEPIVVAVARDRYLSPIHPFADGVHLPSVSAPRYGQDITYGCRASAPQRQSVGDTVDVLKPKMEKLLGIFARADTTGVARTLFAEFLRENRKGVEYFEDPRLTGLVSSHANMEYFCSAALSAPNSTYKTPGRIRIHQALKNADWNIRNLQVPMDLGVPAFNAGSQFFATQDYGNGLGLMINGVQHVYVIAIAYGYDRERGRYQITLKFVLYDVFGLDDDDLREYGAQSDDGFSFAQRVGITAWWQLQHQFAYPPLVTRVVLTRSYEVPAV
ncbi:hypothetical protein [Paracidovorax oryzae]|nr:hypothetical protein [Paracidovorax oryzae]